MSELRDAAALPWLHLLRHTGGGARMRRLLDLHGDANTVLAAPRAALLEQLDGEAARAEALQAAPNPDEYRADLAWLEQPDNHLIARSDPAYPPLLHEIADAPALLFVCGDPSWLSAPQLAVVGSRNPTRGGCENARAFADALVRVGLVITSGLALGIDACAHEAALAGGGRTIAVAGTGLDRVYPAAHRDLAHAIAGHGALVSEFALGTPPLRENFPRRNRLISGLSLGVLVVEAAMQSGSLITARLAADQGREVFAIPGSIHSPLARGCHALIRQGAKLVETAEDIIEELGPLAACVVAPGGATAARPIPEAVDPREAQLLELLGHDPVDMDTLAARSGLTAAAVSSMLLTMELRGLVEAQPGGKYQRTS
jgi:DNA processing protein